jgi:hypothetical protein
MKKNKEKKEKVKIIDDGSTIADMSGVGGLQGKPQPKKKKEPYTPTNLMGRGTLRDQWNTYKNAVKMMFLPMLCVIAALIIIFGVLTLLFSIG